MAMADTARRFLKHEKVTYGIGGKHPIGAFTLIVRLAVDSHQNQRQTMAHISNGLTTWFAGIRTAAPYRASVPVFRW